MRSMVEGAHFGTSRNNPAKHGIHVVENVASGNAHDMEAFSPKQRIARGVAARLVTSVM